VDSNAVHIGTTLQKMLLPPSSGQNLVQCESRIDNPLQVSVFANNTIPPKMHCRRLPSSNVTHRCLLTADTLHLMRCMMHRAVYILSGCSNTLFHTELGVVYRWSRALQLFEHANCIIYWILIDHIVYKENMMWVIMINDEKPTSRNMNSILSYRMFVCRVHRHFVTKGSTIWI
jgi:hypothetical protein